MPRLGFILLVKIAFIFYTFCSAASTIKMSNLMKTDIVPQKRNK